MTHPLNRQSISPTGAAAVAAKPLAMGVLASRTPPGERGRKSG